MNAVTLFNICSRCSMKFTYNHSIGDCGATCPHCGFSQNTYTGAGRIENDKIKELFFVLQNEYPFISGCPDLFATFSDTVQATTSFECGKNAVFSRYEAWISEHFEDPSQI